VVDIHTWLSNLTLDVVGQGMCDHALLASSFIPFLGVLSYDFGALNDTPGEFVRLYRNLL
jgi:hypothetical protein